MKIAIVADEFKLGSPAQQLLDRFLIGAAHEVTAIGVGEILERRVKDHGLRVGGRVEDAEAVVAIEPKKAAEVLSAAKGPVFVYGLLGKARQEAAEAIRIAEKRKIPLCAGTVGGVLRELPPLPKERVREALVVAPPGSELVALDGLMAVADRSGAKFGKDWTVHVIDEETVWQRRDQRWSGELLEAALTRSDKILGKTLEDGRTENVAPRVAELAKKPRMAVYEPGRGWRAGILIVEELLGDIVLGMKTRGGKVHSTQLFQAPEPQREEFSRLAVVIDEFFRTRKSPWGLDRAYATAVVAEQLPGFGPGPGIIKLRQ